MCSGRGAGDVFALVGHWAALVGSLLLTSWSNLQLKPLEVLIDMFSALFLLKVPGLAGSTVVKALCYKSEGRWFDSRWCHWNFSLT